METYHYSQRHGLITLGEVQSFLRDIVGDDALYEIAKEKMDKQELTNKEKDSCKKIWDRYCREETKNHEKIKDYIDYKFFSHNSISALSSNFFYKLIIKYEISNFWIDVLQKFALSFYETISQYYFSEKQHSGFLAAECITNSLVYLNICKTLYYIIKSFSKEADGLNKTKKEISIVLDNFTYKDLFEQLKIELNCKSFEKMYEQIGYDSSKNKISKCIKSDSIPQWDFLEKKILCHCSAQLRKKFITKFLLNRAVLSAKKNLFVTDNDFSDFKEILCNFCNEKNKDQPEDLLNNLFSRMKQNKGDPFKSNKDKMESGAAIDIYELLMKGKESQKVNINFFELKIDSMNEFAPIIAPFFVPWFKAIYHIAKRDFTKSKSEDENFLKAIKLFDEAFQYKYLAGDFIKPFLEMGFIFNNYLTSNFYNIAKTYKYDAINENQKNPISVDAKKFINFGYAINLFPESAYYSTEKALKANDLFHNWFPPSFYFDKEKAKELYAIEKENDHISEIDESQIYDKLKNLSAKERNNLIFIKKVVSNDSSYNSNQKQLYPPISICFRYCLCDERLLTLAEEWLADNSLNITKPSFEGLTPLCEAFILYKNVRLRFERGNLLIQKLEKIISIMIDKIDYDSELQFGERIFTLSYAIDSFNSHFVKKLTEKIPANSFQEYRLHKNLSPLMFAVKRKQPVSLGFKEFIRIQKDINMPKMISLNEFNFTLEDAEKEFEYYNPRPKYIDEYLYHRNQEEMEITEEDRGWYLKKFGDPEHQEIQDWQVQELDKIIDFFINYIKDIDLPQNYFRNADGDFFVVTPLIYAAQHNDTDTCRKLLEKGAASFSREFGFQRLKYGEKYFSIENNLVNNLCIYKSWETLIMVFDEFPEITKKSLDFNNHDVNSFILLATILKKRFIWAGKEKKEYRPIAEYLINRFIEIGADPDCNSSIGSARDILSGTKLLN